MLVQQHLYLLLFLVKSVVSTQYWNSFEQYNTTVSATWVQCLGYETCAFSSIEATSSYLHCFSSRSCLGSNYVIGATDVAFQGYFGGAFSSIIINKTPIGGIECHGSFGCVDTTVFLKSADGSSSGLEIDCKGSHSCMHSFLKTKDDAGSAPSKVVLRSAWSGYNATIIANSSFSNSTYFMNINITFAGWYSGYGLDVACQDKSSCHVCGLCCFKI